MKELSRVEPERERLGSPPSAKEITAYKRGDLQPAAAERVRARIAAAQRRPLRRVAAIAACVTIALLAGLLIESRSEIERLSRQHGEAYVHQSRYELRNILTRGAGPDQTTYELRAGEERYLLAPTLSHQYDYSARAPVV
jgi:hypothetical protein